MSITYKLAGRITHIGLPVSGITVVLTNANVTAVNECQDISCTTTAKGEYQFAVDAGTYRLVVKPSESTSFVRQEFAEIVVSANTVLNVALTTGFVLKGKVVTKGGAKFGPCLVVLEEANNNLSAACQLTDSNCRFNFILSRGQYNLFLRSQSTSNVFITNSFNSVELAGDLEVEIVVPDMVEFSGHVVDSNDKPQPETRVIISPSQKHRYLPHSDKASYCLSDSNGDFKVQIEASTYDFTFQPAEFSPLTEHKEEAVVVSRDLKRTYVLAFGYRLSGTVSFAGIAVDNCQIEICADQSSKPSFIACNNDGIFSCGLIEGTYNLKVVPPKNGQQVFAPWTGQIKVACDLDLNVELLPGTIISGLVADREGKPLPMVPVSIYGHDANVLRDTTDSGGRFSLAAVPGKYQICINDDRVSAESIDVGNEPFEHNLSWDSACLVRFKVVSEEDEAVSSCKVSWEPYSPHDTQGQAKLLDIDHGVRLGATHTDADGICQMILPDGIYSFHFDPAEHSACENRVIRQLSIAGEFKRKVKLSPKKQQV